MTQARRQPSDGVSIALASEPPFALGPLAVDPATRQVSRGGVSQTLEPRVMQVLVALARNRGGVVSRDELVERCWDGRIVGDNAINRVISLVRHLAADFGAGAFEVETITKVGYRLIVHDAPAPAIAARPARASPAIARRAAIAALAVAGAGLAGFASWRGLVADADAAARARMLCASGRDAMRQGLPEHNVQAVAYFRRATETDPDSAEAWGGLALGYQRLMAFNVDAELEAQAAWSRSAARHALALDPGNADAEAALVLIRPAFRNWAALERDCRRALERHPGHAVLEGELGHVFCDVGRSRDAVPIYRRLLSRDPFHMHNQFILALGLWGAGELAEADALLTQAVELWPAHRYLWFTRFDFLALTGRPGAALAFASDLDARPVAGPREPPPRFDVQLAYAQALRTRARADIDAAITTILAARETATIATIQAAIYLAALGDADAAFPLLHAYYLGGDGPDNIRDGPGPLSRRQTVCLFGAPMASVRADPRFATLTRTIGLDDYWRATGTRPDYRA